MVEKGEISSCSYKTIVQIPPFSTILGITLTFHMRYTQSTKIPTLSQHGYAPSMHSFFLSPTVPPVDEGRCTGYFDLQPLSHRSEVSSSAETVNYGRRAPERVDLTPETICPILVADLWGSPQKRRIFCKYKPRFFWWSWVRFRVRFFFFFFLFFLFFFCRFFCLTELRTN